MTQPPFITKGLPPKILKQLEDWFKYLISCQPLAGFGTTISEAHNGAGRSINAAPGGPAGVAGPTHPFMGVYTNEKFPGNAAGDWGIRVIYGTVNGTRPTGFTVGDATPFFVKQSALPAEGVFYVHVVVTASQDAPGVTWGAITVEHGASVPEPEEDEEGDGEDPPGDFYLELFSFAEDSEDDGPNPKIGFGQAVTTSLGLVHSQCKEWFTVPLKYQHSFSWRQL